MPKTVIPKWDEGSIQAHRENCPWCQEKAKQREEEIRLRSEEPRRLQYILIVIGKAKDDIDYYERKKAEFELLEQKKKEKGEEAVPDYWIEKEKLRLISYDAAVAKSTIEKKRLNLESY